MQGPSWKRVCQMGALPQCLEPQGWVQFPHRRPTLARRTPEPPHSLPRVALWMIPVLSSSDSLGSPELFLALHQVSPQNFSFGAGPSSAPGPTPSLCTTLGAAAQFSALWLC